MRKMLEYWMREQMQITENYRELTGIHVVKRGQVNYFRAIVNKRNTLQYPISMTLQLFRSIESQFFLLLFVCLLARLFFTLFKFDENFSRSTPNFSVYSHGTISQYIRMNSFAYPPIKTLKCCCRLIPRSKFVSFCWRSQ